jgi:ribosomal protein L31E
MDNIYNCATYLSAYRAINLVKDKLAKESASLNARLTPKLNNQLQQIKNKMQ